MRKEARCVVVRIVLATGLVASVLGLSRPAAADPRVFVVNTTADSRGACDSECSLREAVMASNDNAGNDTIQVPAGLFTLTQAAAYEDNDERGDLDITDDVRIIGSGVGVTIIDGGFRDRVFDLRCERAGDSRCYAYITNLTIQNGTPYSGEKDYRLPDSGYVVRRAGGGILSRHDEVLTLASVEIRYSSAVQGGGLSTFGSLDGSRLYIVNNRASMHGGGIQNFGPAEVRDSKLAANEARGWGGGASNNVVSASSSPYGEFTCNADARLTVVRGTISGNFAQGLGTSVTSGLGGGLSNCGTATHPGRLFLRESTVVTSNHAVEGGGIGVIGSSTTEVFSSLIDGNRLDFQERWWGAGIHQNGGYVDVRDSQISNNTGARRGGGAYLSGDGRVHNTTVSGNAATEGAGGLAVNGSVWVDRSSVHHNTAPQGGGLEVQSYGRLTLENSTVSTNTASSIGGGVAVGFGDLVAKNATITKNSAPNGAGVHFSWGGDGSMHNTIVKENVGGGSDCDDNGGFDSAGYNLRGTGTCVFAAAGDVTAPSAGLGALQPNGGVTYNHALLGGSPAIDAGDAADCPYIDQRQATRPRDGNLDGTVRCDIGAYELNLSSVTVSPSGEGWVTSSPAGISCPKVCTAYFASEVSVSLSPRAADGWRFAYWTGTCSSRTYCWFTVSGAKSVGAYFSATK